MHWAPIEVTRFRCHWKGIDRYPRCFLRKNRIYDEDITEPTLSVDSAELERVRTTDLELAPDDNEMEYDGLVRYVLPHIETSNDTDALE